MKTLADNIPDSCGGDPIQCIEMILNLQDVERKPNVISAKCESDKPVMSASAFGTPLYIQAPSYPPISISASSSSSFPPAADLQHHRPGEVLSSTLSFTGIPSVVTTCHQSSIKLAPSPVTAMHQMGKVIDEQVMHIVFSEIDWSIA